MQNNTDTLINLPVSVFGLQYNFNTNHFIKNGLESDGNVMVALSMESPDYFRKSLRELGVNAVMFENINLLKIVDWYSYKKERIINVEVDGSLIKSSQDLTYLGIAMDMAITSAQEGAPTFRAVIKVIPSAILTYDFETVYEFTQSIKAKLKKKAA